MHAWRNLEGSSPRCGVNQEALSLVCVCVCQVITQCNAPTADDNDGEPSWLEKVFTGKGSSLALAFVCSKAMVPIKLPVAAAITPYVHR
eukprot:1073838-Pelagomonas_calceolata.AAC.1